MKLLNLRLFKNYTKLSSKTYLADVLILLLQLFDEPTIYVD